MSLYSVSTVENSGDNIYYDLTIKNLGNSISAVSAFNVRTGLFCSINLFQ